MSRKPLTNYNLARAISIIGVRMSRNKTQVALLGEALLIEGLELALSNSDHVHPGRVPAGSGGES